MKKLTSYNLFFEIWGYDKNPKKKGAKAICVAAWKEVFLPFVPSLGMEIFIESILSDHPNADAFGEALKKTQVIATGIFQIERIHIALDNEGQNPQIRLETSLLCDWGNYPRIEDVNTVVDQLVHGRGFKRYGSIQS